MKNLFIDANIWLSLFYFTSDDLDQFSKLKELLGSDIILFVPAQIYNEVYRNRENKIKDALDRFEKFDLQFPAFIKNYEEYQDFYKKFSDLKREHRDWIKAVRTDIAEQTTPADIVIKDFFNAVEIIPSTPEIVQAGVLRYNIGNPPGKDRKYGDAINWETLLSAVPNGEDLFFVSADKDYASLYDDKVFHPFLAKEWEARKGSKIIFFKSLVDFLNEHVKEIHLQQESKKDDLIESLAYSRNFANTHSIIKELSNYAEWTVRQIQDICKAAVDNFQVSWILGDDDVQAFYTHLLENGSVKGSSDPNIILISSKIEKLKEASFLKEIDIIDDSDSELPF